MTALKPALSTSGATVNQNLGSISWESTMATPNAQQQLQGTAGVVVIYNESQCGLIVTLNNSQRSFRVPAGAWSDPIPTGTTNVIDTSLSAVVEYTLSNPVVMQVAADYFGPGEPIILSHVLGNSPVGGQITTMAALPIDLVSAKAFPVNNSTATTIISQQMPSGSPPLVIVSLDFVVGSTNTNNGSITITVSFTSNITLGAQVIHMTSPTGTQFSSTAITKGNYITCQLLFIDPTASNIVTVTYQNSAAGTITDLVNCTITQLA